MIPKKIHYIWFGRGEKNDRVKHCIESWKKYLPDYEIIEWNEDNFDVNFNDFTKKAYENKKWDYVSDVARLWILYNEGGIYMDTDVEVLKPYDNLLHLSGFTGYEGSKYLPPVTGTMASEAGGQWVKEQLSVYDGIHFLKDDGTLDLTTNTIRISSIMRNNGFIQDGEKRLYKDMTIFPSEYFCPRQTTGEYFLTENTYCDHHFTGSWYSSSDKKNILKKVLGDSIMIRLIKIKRKLFG